MSKTLLERFNAKYKVNGRPRRDCITCLNVAKRKYYNKKKRGKE